jgi:hypothetical protein
MLSRGSEWRRWEPHIHAPGTVMNNQFSGPNAWDDYLTALEQATPIIEAIAVTDGGHRGPAGRRLESFQNPGTARGGNTGDFTSRQLLELVKPLRRGLASPTWAEAGSRQRPL